MRNKLFLGLMPVAVLIASGLLATASSAPAETQCSARNDLVEQLDTQYGEMPAAVGQVDEQSLVEIFVSEQGTWTILVSGTDGGACILATGEGWDSTKVLAAAAMPGA
jgi:hypothetical protein